MEETQETSQASKSYTSTPSSGYSYEADSLSVKLNRDFPRNWFELKRQGILMNYEEMLVRYNNCFVCLQQKFTEVNLLEEENLKLRAENLDLSMLISAKEKDIISSITGLSSSKGDSSSGANNPNLLRLAASKLPQIWNTQCGEEKGKGVELLEVYNQGMAKTELCNKWEETGCCPYGERCQFAHGIEELRPVIRHPRYKTEICRMISSGTANCPYGHRCHFRHSLDPNEDKAQVLL
ncbi:zinc finger protein [Macleaya cordata]|uniref:Zinc finger protein n=1 Tax=Macleaya cordata TaxID=56857 RepID=A0A200PWL2_MACCD|nr:zinc finger protein [Macleaya cordata]